MAFLCLLVVWRRDEACFMGVVARLPDGDDLIDRDVAALPVIITQLQHAGFNFQHITAHARRAAAVNVDLLPDELR